MDHELTGPPLDSYNALTEYANFAAGAGALRKRIEAATGLECVGLPKYPFPEVWLASPEPFDTSGFQRALVEEALKPAGRSVFSGATYIYVPFAQRFPHPDGSVRSGFCWGVNTDEDTREMLEVLLARGIPIDGHITLAWGENPFDILDERSDAALYIHNHRDLDPGDRSGYTLGSENNTEAFAARLQETGTSDWLHWAWITSGSNSPLFAHLLKDLIVKVKEVTRQPVAASLFVSDVFQDGFDKEDGQLLLPEELASLSVDQLVARAIQISQDLAPFRSNTFS